MRAAYERRVQQAGQPDVVDETAAAGEQRTILEPGQARADQSGHGCRPRTINLTAPRLGATLPWRGRVAERSEAGWGECQALWLLYVSPHPARLRYASLASAGDPPPPGEGGSPRHPHGPQRIPVL